MVYDWDNKEELCYRMYIEEKKSLEEIMDYMKDELKFAPSKRAFQTQFKRWDFPSKQNPAHKNAALVQRVKELWDSNTSQREMLRLLNDEGFEIKERELMRVRAKNRWLLRVPNVMKKGKDDDDDDAHAAAAAAADQDVIDQLQAALYPDQMVDADGEEENFEDMPLPPPPPPPPQPKSVLNARASSPPLSPEVLAKRQERLAKLQAESAERWATRKRRRRTRGWAGLPADPPGPPRFPSETTIDESKAFLSLDNRMYRDIRNRFQRICEEEGIIKKTIAGPERWEAAKDRLIQESPHLQTVFWNNEDNQEAKKLALDVISSDVTKRIRTLERRMTIAEAKNALGINPEESRMLRNSFYQTLKADHFTSKLEAGEEHWKELKDSWIGTSQLLQDLLAPGDADPQHQQKVKAMEVLCRDVMKRLRDDQTKRDPTRKRKPETTYAPSNTMGSFDNTGEPHTLPPTPHPNLVQTAARAQAQSQVQSQTIPSRGGRQQPPLNQSQPQLQMMMDQGNMQIDPSLLLAAANDPGMLGRNMHNQFTPDQHYADPSYGSAPPQQTSIAVYFRLHPASDVQATARLWVSTLSTISLQELRQLAANKYPGTYAYQIEGIVKQPNGQESPLQIESDDELEAYLAGAGGLKPTFSVQLVGGWKG